MTSSLLRFSGAAALALTVSCAVGAWPTWRMAGTDGLVAMGVAVGLSWIGAVLGFLPSTSGSARFESRVQAAMLGVVVRLFATLAAVFVVVAGDLVSARMAFAAWVAVGYLILLVLETIAVLKIVRRPESGDAAVSA